MDLVRERGVLKAHLHLSDRVAEALAPDGDTRDLADRLGLDSKSSSVNLELEILVALLLAPVALSFPTHSELCAAVRIRKNIVEAARRTLLDFDTEKVDRPCEYWAYDDDRGFVLNSGRSLIEALRKATQPDDSARSYCFSCWRATEYVLLLAMAIEIERTNPELFVRLAQQAETRALKSAQFDQAYTRQYGSWVRPLPLKHFIPGDRTWFKNPDPASSAVTGYEGSYTFYLGSGAFADFWRKGRSYTLESKCMSVYYWRQSIVYDVGGSPQVNDERAEALTEQTLHNAARTCKILRKILKLQTPPGQLGSGCIEPTRDHPRFVCRETCDIALPDADGSISFDGVQADTASAAGYR